MCLISVLMSSYLIVQIFIVNFAIYFNWWIVHAACDQRRFYTDFIRFYLWILFFRFFLNTQICNFLSQSNSPAPVDTNSVLAFIPYFLAHTASSMWKCQVTMLINKSVLAAVKILAVLSRPGASRIIWAASGGIFFSSHRVPETWSCLPLWNTQKKTQVSHLLSTIFTFNIITIAFSGFETVWDLFGILWGSPPPQQIKANKQKRRAENWVTPLFMSRSKVVPRLSWRLCFFSFFIIICLSLDGVESGNEYSHANALDVQLASARQICRGNAATLQRYSLGWFIIVLFLWMFPAFQQRHHTYMT